MAYIELKDVSFTYPGGFLAVDHLNLTIEKGENIAIVGQNGAGKTTTVKLMNALHYPTEGDVIIDGMNTRNYTTAQVSRKVGYVFQNPDDQIFHSTVYEEVAFGPKMMKLPEEQQKKQINYALQITSLGKYVNENPYNLPLSIRKFVTIAAIVATDCDVMIFDEPTAGQDFIGNKRLAWIILMHQTKVKTTTPEALPEIIRQLQKKGKTLVTISHDMVFVADNFDRVVVMCQKKKLADGTPREVFWNHAVLDRAMLKQPYVSSLCKALGVSDSAICMNEAVDAIVAAAGKTGK